MRWLKESGEKHRAGLIAFCLGASGISPDRLLTL